MSGTEIDRFVVNQSVLDHKPVSYDDKLLNMICVRRRQKSNLGVFA